MSRTSLYVHSYQSIGIIKYKPAIVKLFSIYTLVYTPPLGPTRTWPPPPYLKFLSPSSAARVWSARTLCGSSSSSHQWHGLFLLHGVRPRVQSPTQTRNFHGTLRKIARGGLAPWARCSAHRATTRSRTCRP